MNVIHLAKEQSTLEQIRTALVEVEQRRDEALAKAAQATSLEEAHRQVKISRMSARTVGVLKELEDRTLNEVTREVAVLQGTTTIPVHNEITSLHVRNKALPQLSESLAN